ncbi:MAG: acyl-CoA dehydratase activase [Candidatus Zixiibacteriota bacterium]
MSITAGIDVGSTYTKVALVDTQGTILAREIMPTGFKLSEVSEQAFQTCLKSAGLSERDIGYKIATGIGRHMALNKDIHVTDLTASARGAAYLFPGTRTVLDVGGQTMKASRLDDNARVMSFRLNDKCAAGTGAFIEKTARYMGYDTKEIGGLLVTAREAMPVSGVCAVFAESEVINHLSQGAPPADIMLGSMQSLVERSLQLMRRVKAEPEYTLIGGILRFQTMGKAVRDELQDGVNIPEDEMAQFITAFGAAILGQRRLPKLRESEEISNKARN